MSRPHLVVVLVTLAALVSIAGSASAAPKDGCPVGTGWALWTVASAADEVFPNLLPGSGFADASELAAFIDANIDRNGDGAICMKTMWGADLNPKSHWFRVGEPLFGTGVTQYLPRDNTANASIV